MSRFKFKIWDQEESKMIHKCRQVAFDNGYLLKFWDGDSNIEEDNYFFVDKDRLMREYENPKSNEELRFIPLQYTGFENSDGNEIYEGDILKSDKFPDSWFQVYYFDPEGAWMVTKSEEGISEDCVPISDIMNTFGDPKITIVGNYLTHEDYCGEEDGKDE